MKEMRTLWLITVVAVGLIAVLALHVVRGGTPARPTVTVLRAPHNGIQPQTVLETNGVLHLIYFSGEASAGDIDYVRREPGAKDFAPPIRVNKKAKSAVAIGTVRGPQMSIGRNGRVYVIWFGPQSKPGDPTSTMPVFFSMLNDAHTAFEPQRNLVQYATGGDGGLSVASDVRGNVYAAWHATGSEPGEEHRRVYLARSSDDGKTFAREVPISPPELGACGCCGMRAFADKNGFLYVLYRAAAGSVHRDMTLLVSTDGGVTFRPITLDRWELNACPMSTGYLSASMQGVFSAWEKAGRVFFTTFDYKSFDFARPTAAPGEANHQKHPAINANAQGQTLFVWTEGTGWSKGGSLAWQLFDNEGKALGTKGYLAGVPVWDLPTAFADREGNFTVLY